MRHFPLLVIAIAACGNRVSECHELIEVLNAESAKLAEPGSHDAAWQRKKAGELDAAAQRVTAIELRLEPLRGYRDQYAQLMIDLAAASREAALAGEAKDVTRQQAVLRRLDQLAASGEKLDEAINGYCQGKSD